VPSLLPTSLPTPLPSFSCGADEVALSRRYFPSGAAWGDPDEDKQSTEQSEVLDLSPGDDDGAAACEFVVSGFEDIAGVYVASPQSNGDIWYSLASDPDRTVRPTVDPSGNGYDFCYPTSCTCVDSSFRCGYKGDLTPGSITRWSRTAAEIEECPVDDSAARYRLKLAASDAAAKDNFGFSVAVDGDTIAVGADQEDNGGPGAAYVLRASDGVQLAKLTAADGAAGDRFGVSVAIEDDTVVAGAIKASTGGAAYVFQLSNSYEVETYSADCTEPGTFTYDGRTLHCIELPSGELVDALEVDGGAQTCKYTDTNSCPAGYDIWVPRSYDHAKAVVDTVDEKFLETVGVYREVGDCGGCTGVAMNSDAYDAWVAADTSRVPWTSVAGKPWFVRETAYINPNHYWTAGCWLSTKPAYLGDAGGWVEGEGFNFDDLKVCYCHTDYLCSRNGAEAFLATAYGAPTYRQVATLTASDAVQGDWFGWSVAIDGSTVVVGAPQDDNDKGSVYVFHHRGRSPLRGRKWRKIGRDLRVQHDRRLEHVHRDQANA
jgi:hypothetical protein